MSGLQTIRDWELVARESDFNCAKMAALCSISERQLQRLFKEHVHCTPSHWLRDLQCQFAKQLISQGYSNKAVASELKFASESHFCREFKKVFGISPQSFAQLHGANSKRQATRKIRSSSWGALRKATTESKTHVYDA